MVEKPTQCTGAALETVTTHSKPTDITLFGNCSCPFVQRAWVALEFLEIDYTYYEVDLSNKPAELLEVSPKGLVPGLKLNKYTPARALNESTVILAFLEDLAETSTKRSLLPPISDPYARALVRLQADVANRNLVPAFYRFIQAQDDEKQAVCLQEFNDAIAELVRLFERAEKETSGEYGLWKEGGKLSLADVMAGPWIFRATNVLRHYRGFTFPSDGKFNAYLDRLLNDPHFKKTCSTDQLYIAIYASYAENKPGISQVAAAINSGRGLP